MQMVVTQDQVFQFLSHNIFTTTSKKFRVSTDASYAIFSVLKVASLPELYRFIFQPNHKTTKKCHIRLHVKLLNYLMKLRKRITKSSFLVTSIVILINTF